MSYQIDTVTDRAFIAFCEASDTPITRHLLRCFRNGDWLAFLETKVDPRDYANADDYLVDAQAYGFFCKFEDLPVDIDKKAAAIKSTLSAERKCCLTNAYFSRYLNNGPYEPTDAKLLDFVELVKKEVYAIVGRTPDGSDIEFRFGPGATLSDSGFWCTVPNKVSSAPTITSSALGLLPIWAKTAWARAHSATKDELHIVDSARYTTVPKKATTHRGIEIQPSINVAAQLALGRILRARLRQFGKDLNVMQDLHRHLAREASKGILPLATIDLKSASDLISKAVVKLLMPAGWFSILNCLRTSCLEIDGERYILERFSSMGNGFTFELETILFLAIVRAASSHKDAVSVFGDDIICHLDDYSNVVLALRWFGFLLNEEKSFHSGPFRESCGGDYFKGAPVRPYYLKESPNEPQKLLSFANGLRRASQTEENAPMYDHRFSAAWEVVVSNIPTDIRRCRGPQELGDLLLHTEAERWSYRVRNWIKEFRVYKPYSFEFIQWSRFAPDQQFAAALYGTSLGYYTRTGQVTGRKNGIAGVLLRDAVQSYILGWAARS